MMTTLLHYLAYAVTRFVRAIGHVLPKSIVISILFRILLLSKYRHKTIIENLRASFPTKSNDELLQIQKSYYKFLSQVSVGHLFDYTKARVHFHNVSEISRLIDRYQHLIVVGSHYGYFETIGKAITHHIPTTNQYVAYKKIRNPYIDTYLKKLRSDTVATPIEQKRIYRHIVQNVSSDQQSAYYLITDQYPSSLQNREIYTFLNQETWWINSIRKIAEKKNLPMVYLQWNEKLGEDHYADVVVIHDPSLEASAPIENYITALENQIKNDPSKWLWSHKRWKNLRNT